MFFQGAAPESTHINAPSSGSPEAAPPNGNDEAAPIGESLLDGTDEPVAPTQAALQQSDEVCN